jgi:hypothetical protein
MSQPQKSPIPRWLEIAARQRKLNLTHDGECGWRPHHSRATAKLSEVVRGRGNTT